MSDAHLSSKSTASEEIPASKDPMNSLKLRAAEEISSNVFSWFHHRKSEQNDCINTFTIGSKFIQRAVYDQDTFLQTVSYGGVMMSKYIDNLPQDGAEFFKIFVDTWSHYYTVIIPKLELIFRNITEFSIYKHCLIAFGNMITSHGKCKMILLNIGKFEDNKQITHEYQLKIKQMIGLIISAMREESFPLASNGLAMYSIYESLFGPQPFLIE